MSFPSAVIGHVTVLAVSNNMPVMLISQYWAEQWQMRMYDLFLVPGADGGLNVVPYVVPGRWCVA